MTLILVATEKIFQVIINIANGDHGNNSTKNMAAIELDVDERIDFIGEICMKVFSVNEEVWTRFSSLHEHHR